MELFAVTLYTYSETAALRFSQSLSRSFRGLHTRGTAAVRWEIDPAVRIVRCLWDAPKPPGSARIAGLIRKTAEASAAFIVSELQPGLIRDIARKNYGSERQEDLQGIEAYSLQYLAGESGAVSTVLPERRQRRMSDELAICLAEYGRVSLEGFVTFRLGAYRKELGEIVADAAQEYMMDRQYREFVALLKTVVEVQETRTPVIHLIHQGSGGEFQLRDGRFRLMDAGRETRGTTELSLLRGPRDTLNEAEPAAEDMIVSALITASPRRIVIHSRQPGLPAIRTIESIFAGRVRICRRCVSCAPLFEEEGRLPDRKST